jgi:hypothetical protein
MSRPVTDPITDLLVVPLPPDMKAEFTAIAEKQAKPVGELLRELIDERLKLECRRELQAEAECRRLEPAAAPQHPDIDEAAILRELKAHLDSLAAVWKAR